MFFFFLFSTDLKKDVLIQTYSEHTTTLYTDCQIDKHKISCEGKEHALSIEHIVPVDYFSRALQSTLNKKNKLPFLDLKKKIPEIVFFKQDLHNQILEPPFINNLRSNLPFRDNETYFFKKTIPIASSSFTIQPDRVILPENYSRGFVARAFLYVQWKYQRNILTEEDLQLFEEWDNLYPPLEQECSRNKIIEKSQGWDNPFITRHCDGLTKEIVSTYKDQPNFQHGVKYFYIHAYSNDQVHYSFKIKKEFSTLFYTQLVEQVSHICNPSFDDFFIKKSEKVILLDEVIIHCTGFIDNNFLKIVKDIINQKPQEDL